MSIQEFFGVFVFGLLVGGALGVFAGYMLATHVHAVASAASRALTVPHGEVAALNAKVDGLGDKLQAVVQSAGQPVASAIGSLPQPVGAASVAVPASAV